MLAIIMKGVYTNKIYHIFIKTKKGDEYNYALWNKLRKRKIVNKAFKWIGEKYLKEKLSYIMI